MNQKNGISLSNKIKTKIFKALNVLFEDVLVYVTYNVGNSVL